MTGQRQIEYQACLALKHTPGLGARTWKALLEHFGSASLAIEGLRSWTGLGLASGKHVAAFRSREWAAKAEAEQNRAAEERQAFLLWSDPEYPQLLREIADPPLCLYYKGRLDLARGPCLAVVGSRTCSAYGLTAAKKISHGLSEAGITVVSGMAWGIDRQAHLAGLEGPGSTVGVLGTGLEQAYPRKNKDLMALLEQKGLLLSEFAPGTAPCGTNFPSRNRIISGLSLGVLLVEAPLRSGGRITTRLALEQGREVYVVAGPEGMETFAGCRELAQQGARAVTSAGEIILDLAPLLRAEIRARENGQDGVREVEIPEAAPSPPRPPKEPAPDLSDEERALIGLLDGNAGVHIDVLGRSLGWEARKVSEVLLRLEMQGLVTQLPGMCYSAGP